MSQFSQYFAIEKKLKGIIPDESREDLISQFTNNRKRSLRALSPHEYREFLNWLQKTFISTALVSSDVMRKKIIATFVRMGYTTDNGKIDMDRIYSWTEKYGYLKKHLNAYSYSELPALVSQVEKMYKSHLNSI